MERQQRRSHVRAELQGERAVLSMLKVFQVSVRRAVRSGVCSPARRVPAAGRAGPVPGSGAAAARGLTRQLCSRDGRTVRSCTVDPNLEEHFVFVDCTGETPTLRYKYREHREVKYKYCNLMWRIADFTFPPLLFKHKYCTF